MMHEPKAAGGQPAEAQGGERHAFNEHEEQRRVIQLAERAQDGGEQIAVLPMCRYPAMQERTAQGKLPPLAIVRSAAYGPRQCPMHPP